MEISVVIPTYNGLTLLEVCLPALAAAIERAGCADRSEIIVVDDCSTDGTADFLRNRWPAVVCIRTPRNSGFAVAVNLGLGAARGRWIGLLNNDTAVEPDWLVSAAKHFSRPGVGAVATRIVLFDHPDTLESAGDEYSAVGVPMQFGNLRAADHVAACASRVCFSGCGASVFYRKAALDDVGLLYAPLGAYYEDVELGFRLNLRGWDCVYEPDSVCRHRGSASYGRGSYRQKFQAARNAEIVFFSCMPSALLIRYLASHLLAVAMHLLYHTVRGTGRPFLAGKWSFLGLLRQTLARRRTVQKLRTVSSRALAGKIERHWFRLLVLRRRGRD